MKPVPMNRFVKKKMQSGWMKCSVSFLNNFIADAPERYFDKRLHVPVTG